MRKAAPRSLAAALDGLTATLAPATTLARVHEVWERVAGSTIAAAARPPPSATAYSRSPARRLSGRRS